MPKLFYDDEGDALSQVISNSERTVKECAMFLFPGMKPESAYARLKVCLTAGGDQYLRLGQIVALCKFCGTADALYFLADELDHDRPAKRAPEDELTALLRRYVEIEDEKAAMKPRIDAARAKAGR